MGPLNILTQDQPICVSGANNNIDFRYQGYHLEPIHICIKDALEKQQIQGSTVYSFVCYWIYMDPLDQLGYFTFLWITTRNDCQHVY